MSNKSLILPKIEEKMKDISESNRKYGTKRFTLAPNESFYNQGFYEGLEFTKRLLLGIGVEVQSAHYPQDLKED